MSMYNKDISLNGELISWRKIEIAFEVWKRGNSWKSCLKGRMNYTGAFQLTDQSRAFSFISSLNFLKWESHSGPPRISFGIFPIISMLAIALLMSEQEYSDPKRELTSRKYTNKDLQNKIYGYENLKYEHCLWFSFKSNSSVTSNTKATQQNPLVIYQWSKK